MTRYQAIRSKSFYIPEDGKYNMPVCEMLKFQELNTDKYRIVTKGEQFNPDLIAFNEYGDESLYWVILMANNILDPFSELYAGKTIRIPSKYMIDMMQTQTR